ncbi:hypothetical protein JW758_04630 [Candidatus Peregrinibacteria bacterium]|nr:hypothetical protein [Candidatus Peregrinibacteria bacterium]
MPIPEKKTILIAENDQEILTGLINRLRRKYNLETTMVVEDALMQLSKLRGKINLIITSWDFAQLSQGAEIIRAGKMVGVQDIIVYSHEAEVNGIRGIMMDVGADYIVQKRNHKRLFEIVSDLLS